MKHFGKKALSLFLAAVLTVLTAAVAVGASDVETDVYTFDREIVSEEQTENEAIAEETEEGFAVSADAEAEEEFALLADAETEDVADDAAYNYIPGDVNNDGCVFADDARTILRIAVGLDSWYAVAARCNYSDFYDYRSAADANGDGFVHADDARLVLRVSVGLEPGSALKESVFSSKSEIMDFYTKSVAAICCGGNAGYNKTFYQELKDADKFSVLDSSLNNKTLKKDVTAALTSSGDAKPVCYALGTKEARYYFPKITMNEFDYVTNTKCTINGSGNYVVTLVFAPAVTTKAMEYCYLNYLTDTLVNWSDAEPVLEKCTGVKNWWNGSVTTQNFTITAELTPDGKFISMVQTADAVISVDEIQQALCFKKCGAKSITVKTTTKYTDFTYSRCYCGYRYGGVSAAFGTITNICDYLGECVRAVSVYADAGYTKKSTIKFSDGDINLPLCAKNKVKEYLAEKGKETVLVTDKNTNASWANFPYFGLTKYDSVSGASCAVNANGNYVLQVTFNNIDTTKSDVYNILQSVMVDQINFDTHVAPAIRAASGVVKYSDYKVTYEELTITAEITPYAKIVGLTQHGKVRIDSDLVINLIPYADKSIAFETDAVFSNFTY